MRRCKKHTTDLSSIIGVCSSCLRERLFKVILEQEQTQAQSLAHINFNPLSASPYITSRKSDTSVASVAPLIRQYNKPRLNHSLSDQRFFNSPQIAINTRGCIGSSSSNTKKQSLIRFSSFSNLFRSKSRNGNGDAKSNSNEPSGVEGKVCVRDRGMSPVQSPFEELSSGGNRRTPNRLWNMKGKPPAPADALVVPHLSYTKSFYANRSRKLADFGRPNLNS